MKIELEVEKINNTSAEITARSGVFHVTAVEDWEGNESDTFKEACRSGTLSELVERLIYEVL